MATSLEDLQDEVFSKLQLLDITQLGEVCAVLSIDVPETKKGKKTGTRSFILNHLTSNAVEELTDVEEIFRSLNETLNGGRRQNRWSN